MMHVESAVVITHLVLTVLAHLMVMLKKTVLVPAADRLQKMTAENVMVIMIVLQWVA
jgi:hypothetical protein